MKIDLLLDKLFLRHHQVSFEGHFFCGKGKVADQDMAIIGTSESTSMGVEMAQQISGEVLRIIREHPGQPILLLIDTKGQRLRRRDELLGINGYLAHLARSIELARIYGHRVISLVYSLAVSGGYLSSSMLADSCYALANAEIRVMRLMAMARITKIPVEKLKILSRTSPVFAPGVTNYMKMGALEGLWEDNDNLNEALVKALSKVVKGDQRKKIGEQRGGRMRANWVSNRVRQYVVK